MYGKEVEDRMRELILNRRRGNAASGVANMTNSLRGTVDTILKQSDDKAQLIARQRKNTIRYTYAHMTEGQSVTTGGLAGFCASKSQEASAPCPPVSTAGGPHPLPG